ncbi:hypothetical protein [Synechococcus phage S-B68]|nr:hypothetical protein [Synechococcus phage S-B68]
MNILSDTRGTFKFLNKEYQEVVFEDWNDIPEDFQFSHLIQFLPNIPPPPHTPEQHLEIGEWNDRMKTLLERERACRNQNR